MYYGLVILSAAAVRFLSMTGKKSEIRACIFQVIGLASGHGRLEDPPGRSTMWRQGFENPANYNDDEVYCGGFGGN
jgi:hypothetical protein